MIVIAIVFVAIVIIGILIATGLVNIETKSEVEKLKSSADGKNLKNDKSRKA